MHGSIWLSSAVWECTNPLCTNMCNGEYGNDTHMLLLPFWPSEESIQAADCVKGVRAQLMSQSHWGKVQESKQVKTEIPRIRLEQEGAFPSDKVDWKFGMERWRIYIYGVEIISAVGGDSSGVNGELTMVNSTFESLPTNKSNTWYGVSQGDGENTTVGCSISWRNHGVST